MLGSSCSPCCGGCECKQELFDKLAASSVTLALTSPVPDQIELTTGYYKRFGPCAPPGQQPQDPITFLNQYTCYKSSDFYKTYTLALDAQLTVYNCYRQRNGRFYNTSVVGFAYSDTNIDLEVQFQLSPANSDGSAPTFYRDAMQKIGSTKCYFGARMQARLYDRSAVLDYGQLPSAFSWNKTTRNCNLINSTPPYTQKKWEIEPAPTSWCGDDNFSYSAPGFWDKNYAPSGATFGRTAYADLGNNELWFSDNQMTSATISNNFPADATCVVPMKRLVSTRFWTTDSSKQVFCNGTYQTATRPGADSSDSTATGFIEITPP